MKISKKTLVYLGIAVVIIIVAVFGIQGMQKIKAERLSSEYAANLEDITNTMINGAADAENCGNLISSVWRKSIFKIEDSSTDKYTRKVNGTGDFYDNFDDALSNLYNDSDFQNDISNIKENQKTVTTLMKKMKKPPEEWKDSYEDLKDYYDAYMDLTNLVINPSGSLIQFTSNFNSADTDVANYYDIMKSHVDQVY